VPLPKSIDLLIPNLGRSFGELDVTVIDTRASMTFRCVRTWTNG